jgi:hypothetical protein
VGLGKWEYSTYDVLECYLTLASAKRLAYVSNVYLIYISRRKANRPDCRMSIP